MTTKELAKEFGVKESSIRTQKLMGKTPEDMALFYEKEFGTRICINSDCKTQYSLKNDVDKRSAFCDPCRNRVRKAGDKSYFYDEFNNVINLTSISKDLDEVIKRLTNNRKFDEFDEITEVKLKDDDNRKDLNNKIEEYLKEGGTIKKYRRNYFGNIL